MVSVELFLDLDDIDELISLAEGEVYVSYSSRDIEQAQNLLEKLQRLREAVVRGEQVRA